MGSGVLRRGSESDDPWRGAASFSASFYHFCQEVEEFWAVQDVLDQFNRRLANCASPELLPLLNLPGVKLARARQLYKAGYTL